ncbi:High-affnity carbon uptake protein Hat/HatR [Fimbriiglobus ruber]|uniref:High-affnity carbon uptake protein Hat/HatR n=1 Tax=Fimbriiglobus ruber TaxID=1908690 RepID=A0A225E0G4_9BACT|nr:High-affnity carbon uptake protein Hat/HatR [Fimbriiglobus ruber]
MDQTPRPAGLTEAPTAALLAWFAADRNQAAFAELVRRHGPLVLGVCRRTTGHREDAEDAFQATFLILAAKAGRLTHPDRLANWLYGVAYRVARRARRTAARRRAREVQVKTFPDPPARSTDPVSDWGPVVDDELAALPDWYRSAIVLCDLEYASRADAARLLGIPEGTLSSRLAAGRKKLAARLARRGVTLSAAGAGVTAVPAELLARTIEAAGVWVCGGIGISGPITALARGGPITMRTTIMLLAAAAAVAVGTWAVAARGPADPPQAKAGDPPAPPAEVKKPEAAESFVYGEPRRRGKPFNLYGIAEKLYWSPDGKRLAVVTPDPPKRAGIPGVTDTELKVNSKVVQILTPGDERFFRVITPESTAVLLGFTPDGEQFATQVQDPNGTVNATNRLVFWGQNSAPPKSFWPKDFTDPQFAARRECDLDPDAGDEVRLTDDAKTAWAHFRAVGQDGKARFGVRSVNLETGSFGPSAFEIAEDFLRWFVSPNGRLAVTVASDTEALFKYALPGHGTLRGWDLVTGRELWHEISPPAITDSGWWSGHRPNFESINPVFSFSRDGRHVLVEQTIMAPGAKANSPKPGLGMPGGFGGVPGGPGGNLSFRTRLRVLATRTGKEVYQKISNISVSHSELSPDGRLLAYTTPGHNPEAGFQSPSHTLRIVDLNTGAEVKVWGTGSEPVIFAFRPVKPGEPQTLAIAETVNKLTRIGLWELRPEARKP